MHALSYQACLIGEERLTEWCSYKGMSCGECPFSIPAAEDGEDFQEDSSTYECGLLEIMEAGKHFRGYKVDDKE